MLTAVPDADLKLSFSSDAAVTAETCRQLTNSNPDVMWMLLLDVDSAGHSSGWGPTATNYVRAIEIADGRVGEIIGALTNRVTYSQENWLVIVHTDHGEHDHPDPERSRIVFSIVSGLSAARGVMWPSPSIVDVCATVLQHMGVPIDPAWNLDARVEGFPLPPIRYGTNLVFNGDAESNSGATAYATNRGIAWWFDIASTTLGVYGGNPNFPSPASPGPASRGANFFLGGTTNGAITQRIELSDLAAEVDGAGVGFELTGWFGGAGAQGDWAALTARFLSASESVVGSNTVGQVTPTDRGGVTGLLLRRAEGTLPAGTRFVEFTLTNHVTAGANDGSADNLSFVLTPPPFSITAYGEVPGGWQVTFKGSPRALYVLERSSTLQSWSDASPPTAGGAAVSLVDTNAPFGPAFYRIAWRRP